MNARGTRFAIGVFAACVWLATGVCAAGETEDSTQEPAARWSATFATGARKAIGAPDDFMDGLTEGGYTAGTYTGGSYWTAPEYIESPRGGPLDDMTNLRLTFKHSSKLEFSAFVNLGDLAEASGQFRSSEFTSSLRLTSSLQTYGLLCTYQLDRFLLVSIGPALHHFALDVHESSSDGSYDWSQETARLGLTEEISLTIGPGGTTYFLVGFQGHQVSSIDIGPFSRMPVVEVSINHAAWILGFGVRMK